MSKVVKYRLPSPTKGGKKLSLHKLGLRTPPRSVFPKYPEFLRWLDQRKNTNRNNNRNFFFSFSINFTRVRRCDIRSCSLRIRICGSFRIEKLLCFRGKKTINFTCCSVSAERSFRFAAPTLVAGTRTFANPFATELTGCHGHTLFSSHNNTTKMIHNTSPRRVHVEKKRVDTSPTLRYSRTSFRAES